MMNEKFQKAILEQAQALAISYLNQQSHGIPSQRIAPIEKSDLPAIGIGSAETLLYFEHHFAASLANTAGPRYFGFVTGGTTPAALAGDWLVSAFDQNACGNNDSIAPELERQTLHFLKQLLEIDHSYFGTFVSGATMSNFTSLAIARQWVGEQIGIDCSLEGLTALPNLTVLSGTPHSSIFKSLSMLGIGKKNLTLIETLPTREAVDLIKLEHMLKVNDPCIVVANAGTVNTADFDDLDGIGQLKKKYRFWMHVDAAFGGFAACSPKHKHFLKGINHADSITIDAHKWLNVPYDAGMQFTKHQHLQTKVFSNNAAYLGDINPAFMHHTPENSRRFRALPAWFTLMAYGQTGYSKMIAKSCSLAEILGQKIDASKKFKLLAPVRLNVVCFTLSDNPSKEDIEQFLEAIRIDGRTFFTPTEYQGKPAIHGAISNWQTMEKDINIAFEALMDVNCRRKI